MTTEYSDTLLYFIHSTIFLWELSSRFPLGKYRHHLESISIALSSKLDIIWNQYSISFWHSGEEKNYRVDSKNFHLQSISIIGPCALICAQSSTGHYRGHVVNSIGLNVLLKKSWNLPSTTLDTWKRLIYFHSLYISMFEPLSWYTNLGKARKGNIL